MHPLLNSIQAQGLSRRIFLRNLLFTAGSVTTAQLLTGCVGGNSTGTQVSESLPESPPVDGDTVETIVPSLFKEIGPLLPADENGIRLPAGFRSRVVAVSGEQPLPGSSSFAWVADPDGAATFRMPDGGWLYVANAEVRDATSGGLFDPLQPIVSRENVEASGSGLNGGVGVLRFDQDGNLIDAYQALENVTTLCSGVATPWGTWLCGEEITDGYLFECEPLGTNPGGRRLDIFGRKGHEQAAVDEANRTIYHTEDFGGSDRFYRTVFTAADWPEGGRPNLEEGILQVLVVEGGIEAARQGPAPIRWVDAINDGRPQSEVYSDETTIFSGNEGCWFLNGFVFFSNKGDNSLWAIDTIGQTVENIYSPEAMVEGSPVDENEEPLTGVDNITMTDDGDILVVEDGGFMRVMVLLPDLTTIPLLQVSDVTGESEVTGPAFSPDGKRLYVSAQRNGRNGQAGNGITYEITLPFSVNVTRPMASGA
ncbi:MAG: translocation protein TolB [Oleiphilaceae bacterium]|nr:translocation protein TolB [Oleiphilaceae bacterium]